MAERAPQGRGGEPAAVPGRPPRELGGHVVGDEGGGAGRGGSPVEVPADQGQLGRLVPVVVAAVAGVAAGVPGAVGEGAVRRVAEGKRYAGNEVKRSNEG